MIHTKMVIQGEKWYIFSAYSTAYLKYRERLLLQQCKKLGSEVFYREKTLEQRTRERQ